MREIRRIRSEEADAFLGVVCAVFELDIQRARPIYFSDPMYESIQRWGVVEDGEILSVLSVAPMDFLCGRCFGIAGVATVHARQREGLAGMLIEHVINEHQQRGEDSFMLFAKDERLYSRLGFKTVDKTIRARFQKVHWQEQPVPTLLSEVKLLYDDWSRKASNRLLRDEKRWQLWKHYGRLGYEFGDGYLLTEGDLIREALFTSLPEFWPINPSSEWLGLESLAQELRLPLRDIRYEVNLMTRNFPGKPHFFLTDQF